MTREEEINERLAKIDATIQPLRAEAKALVRERDEITTRAAAKAKFASMGDAERSALVQMISAGDIESAEAVGTPGN